MIGSRKDDWKSNLLSAFNHIRKRERPIADRSLYNIMYEKKISYSQDEAYVQ